jgi:hypothetical protein
MARKAFTASRRSLIRLLSSGPASRSRALNNLAISTQRSVTLGSLAWYGMHFRLLSHVQSVSTGHYVEALTSSCLAMHATGRIAGAFHLLIPAGNTSPRDSVPLLGQRLGVSGAVKAWDCNFARGARHRSVPRRHGTATADGDHQVQRGCLCARITVTLDPIA